ncbi:hypothetical protein POM88_035160 [Heracleum sosnowskyi]|uniref:Transposase-associated domain-containing protein n=1 Tax=Heracleum sosnowskyi TaxID=360622 RepID=A0AAD8HLS0_9APIA|nr:hypothetical protein POM88_035160 [Heracleum sosnowskyi]
MDDDYTSWIGFPKSSKEYVKGIEEFMKNAFPVNCKGEEMKCPCKVCVNRNWHLYKKKYYKKYETDDDRMANRPNTIPLEDFKLLVKYRGDEAVQELAEENEAHRASVTDTHTMGPNSMAQVRENLKKGNPDLGSPSDAQVYLDSHEREEGRTYKTNTAEIKKRIIEIKKKVVACEDASELIANGKSYGREWLKGRHGKTASLASASVRTKSRKPSAPVDDPFLDDVTEKIKRDLEVELEAKVNKKVQDNMAMLPKKLAKDNPGLNLDIADCCATIPSEDDENATPFTGTST